MTNTPYEQAKEFHETFEPAPAAAPRAFSLEEGNFRTAFKAEELVEFLYALSKGETAVFEESVSFLHDQIDVAKQKVLKKAEPMEDPLVDQVDALLDLLYFTYGSFALMGVDPAPLFEIIHQANMQKVFPDGKPRYHPITHKVLKPEEWQENYAPEPLLKKELERQKERGKA